METQVFVGLKKKPVRQESQNVVLVQVLQGKGHCTHLLAGVKGQGTLVEEARKAVRAKGGRVETLLAVVVAFQADRQVRGRSVVVGPAARHTSSV